MNDAQYECVSKRSTDLTATTISNESLMSRLHQESCLDLRQLAALYSTDAANEDLLKVIADLRRRGKITRIGGRGVRTSFVPATFER